MDLLTGSLVGLALTAIGSGLVGWGLGRWYQQSKTPHTHWIELPVTSQGRIHGFAVCDDCKDLINIDTLEFEDAAD